MFSNHRRVQVLARQLITDASTEAVPIGTSVSSEVQLRSTSSSSSSQHSSQSNPPSSSASSSSSILDVERANATFQSSEMQTFLDGGDAMFVQLKELAAAAILEDPEMVDLNRYDMDRAQIRERTMSKVG
jgi:hypothetical protein